MIIFQRYSNVARSPGPVSLSSDVSWPGRTTLGSVLRLLCRSPNQGQAFVRSSQQLLLMLEGPLNFGLAFAPLENAEAVEKEKIKDIFGIFWTFPMRLDVNTCRRWSRSENGCHRHDLKATSHWHCPWSPLVGIQQELLTWSCLT